MFKRTLFEDSVVMLVNSYLIVLVANVMSGAIGHKHTYCLEYNLFIKLYDCTGLSFEIIMITY